VERKEEKLSGQKKIKEMSSNEERNEKIGDERI
jgi:hypothetical protein